MGNPGLNKQIICPRIPSSQIANEIRRWGSSAQEGVTGKIYHMLPKTTNY
jgi:hypothetical protein